MAPLRPLVRTFPISFSTRTPVLSSISTIPKSALQQQLLQNQQPAQQQQPGQGQGQNVSSQLPGQTIQIAGFATSARLAAGDSHYDPPTGWLWGVPPGEKREPEGWERVWVWGFWGSLVVAAVAYVYKPDTSIQTWALEEARRRLEAEGILPDPSDKTGK